MSMIEKVAMSCFIDNWKDHIYEAKAVLEALKDPTEEMILAGHDMLEQSGDFTQAYLAAIDAALEDK